MEGDIILVGEEHKRAAGLIIDRLLDEIKASTTRFTITVSGESGSGKSETGVALAEALKERGVVGVVLHQDDYYVLPPKSNDAARRANFAWVGTTEVKLDLLSEHLGQAKAGADSITKPLSHYGEDRLSEETLSLEGAQAIIAEGVYTALCDNVDRRIFIARNRLETMAHRAKRAREEFDPFIEKVLETEHEIISKFRENADIVITRDYDVEFVKV
jgi:uridine kinase